MNKNGCILFCPLSSDSARLELYPENGTVPADDSTFYNFGNYLITITSSSTKVLYLLFLAFVCVWLNDAVLNALS